ARQAERGSPAGRGAHRLTQRVLVPRHVDTDDPAAVGLERGPGGADRGQAAHEGVRVVRRLEGEENERRGRLPASTVAIRRSASPDIFASTAAGGPQTRFGFEKTANPTSMIRLTTQMATVAQT